MVFRNKPTRQHVHHTISVPLFIWFWCDFNFSRNVQMIAPYSRQLVRTCAAHDPRSESAPRVTSGYLVHRLGTNTPTTHHPISHGVQTPFHLISHYPPSDKWRQLTTKWRRHNAGQAVRIVLTMISCIGGWSSCRNLLRPFSISARRSQRTKVRRLLHRCNCLRYMEWNPNLYR